MKLLTSLGPMFLATALLAVPVAASAQDIPNQHPNAEARQLQSPSGTEDPGLVQVEGNVVRAMAGALRLQSGATVYVNNATVIKPEGADLIGATHVVIKGYPNSEDPGGSINATEIDVE
jgi:hypothetical protein